VSERIYYALIDRYSGCLRWVGEARSAEEACTIGSAEADPSREPRRYERIESTSVDDGYDVYATTPGGTLSDATAATEWLLKRCESTAILGFIRLPRPTTLPIQANERRCRTAQAERADRNERDGYY